MDARNCTVEQRLVYEEPKNPRRYDGATELRDPVDHREPRRDPPRAQEPERDRRVEQPTGDVAEVRDHDPDGEAVGEGDGDDVVARDRAGASADEDQRERSDEFGNTSPENALLHRRGA